MNQIVDERQKLEVDEHRFGGHDGLMVSTTTLGYPRIGRKRELKWAVEAFWRAAIPEAELARIGAEIRRFNWRAQAAAGIDVIPSNDFSFYDQMLDMTCLLGNVPRRFDGNDALVKPSTMFLMARGARPAPREEGAAFRGPDASVFAMEMTKWFDTNYHYIVPELRPETSFKLASTKPFDDFNEALSLGIRTKPVLIGPVSYLTLGRPEDPKAPAFDRLSLLDTLIPVYAEVLRKLDSLGAEWVQLDEPVFALDLTDRERGALRESCAALSAAAPRLKLMVTSYFGELRENLDGFRDLPVAGVHFDGVRGCAELDQFLTRFPDDKTLSLGLVDGRNVWRNDLERSRRDLRRALQNVDADRLMVATSCSLLHCPVGLAEENRLDPELKSWLAFAEEKLGELVVLAQGTRDEGAIRHALHENRAVQKSRTDSARIHDPRVRESLNGVTPDMIVRRSPFPARQAVQRTKLRLPPFPTTTIGSFPQTDEVRSARSRWKKGELETLEYEGIMEAEVVKAVRVQEDLGLDVLVHGEPERNDMVEFFGEQMNGFAFTELGWVQSYGSRCVKPPIIFGDVSRQHPMTVRWARFAQGLTSRPMKGMLTGPVTMLQWSFVRDDQPRAATCRQLALALRDEVCDLETAGIGIIQIDEPALREGLPLRRRDWDGYLRWAVDAFRLCASGVRDETQIHSHMCYAEFNDIIGAIAELDADVITIEASRSQMKLLDAFVDFRYPNEIGPGLYDIHSPYVPSPEQMADLLGKAVAVLPAGNLWINPDCGLKTRGWPEVTAALRNMVLVAQVWRQRREMPGKSLGIAEKVDC